MKKKFSIDSEIQKLQCIFRVIKDDWRSRPDLLVEFKDFKDSAPAGESIDSFMKDILTGNQFGNFTIFAAVIKSSKITFWLTISEDDKNSAIKSVFNVYLSDETDPGSNFDGGVDIKAVRSMIWKVYEFFEDGCHLKDSAEKEFENRVMEIALYN